MLASIFANHLLIQCHLFSDVKDAKKDMLQISF